MGGGKIVAGPVCCGPGRVPHTWGALAGRAGASWETRHAEVAALSELPSPLRPRDVRRSRLFVVRFDPDGRPALARPCVDCARLLCAVGVPRVTFTTVDGFETRASRELLTAAVPSCAGRRVRRLCAGGEH